MATESDLLNNIVEESPDIVLLGERHSSKTEFRRIILRLLPELFSIGFRTLALELTPHYRYQVNSFCSGTYNYLTFLNSVKVQGNFAECFDQSLLLVLRFWVQNNGKLIFVNSCDPIESYPTTNEMGRDHIMFSEIASCNEKIVAILGNLHCQLRMSREIQFVSPDEVPDLNNPNFGFLTAAEKLVRANKKVYSFAEFSTINDPSGKNDYADKLMLKGDMDQHLCKIKQEEHVGGGYGSLAPELPRQIVYFVPGDLNAVYIDSVDHYAVEMEKISKSMRDFRAKKRVPGKGKTTKNL